MERAGSERCAGELWVFCCCLKPGHQGDRYRKRGKAFAGPALGHCSIYGAGDKETFARETEAGEDPNVEGQVKGVVRMVCVV